MLKALVAGVIGFFLVFVESMIAMAVMGYETIDFGGIAPFVSVWSMNFFLVFSIIMQVTNWYSNKYQEKEDRSY